jgi:FKBP-type peptidyl-prolyl cis-trans isomerase
MKGLVIFCLSCFILASCNREPNYKDLQTNSDSTAYSLGLLFASKIPQNLKDNSIDSISIKHFLQGVHDYFDSTQSPVLSKQISEKLIQEYFEKLQNSENNTYAAKFIQNKIDGNLFLENNKKVSGVIEIQKGLQYQIFYKGWGELKPDLRDTLLVHFKISTIKNKVLYDSRKTSYNPLKIPLDSTIAAWQKILPLVNTGAKIKIFTSYEYAYGIDVTKEDNIEPYQTLIFDIELVKTLKGNYPGAQVEQDSLSKDSVTNNH